MTGRLVRLAEKGRLPVRFTLDGSPCQALAGDTVLTAVLTSARSLRAGDAGPERRAGFCLMGACQDCWIWQEDGPRLRACSTPVAPGMRLLSQPPESWP
ncbi:(2Fe-2S)-binding protein [Rhodovulum sp. BSW8]|uniref:(2Fe-2S)-binding protein n=1 Tax=Rhodovulum visakhapatnamense TaxID=364297 RepID=A0ABS1RDY5_9RHOB|nr:MULTISPECIES: (2Fe-2S)-binding protein [Rhodovulum]MBL3569859.1 (2Fe-2S)-binding protein [Rhodovulum visakhapatnamense]MBL3577745.1 (2Fe-2S)-binding protein [Rhodovulum visakhapatnamense]OLS43608.1 NAD(FAD)-dependent dehydrogenase [Rhodovulum sulfidophilum]RBO51289.1 (2Fe-2S)-binding protein [Rhodovulum sp. BSW8]